MLWMNKLDTENQYRFETNPANCTVVLASFLIDQPANFQILSYFSQKHQVLINIKIVIII